MRIFLAFIFLVTLLFGSDATLEIVKKVEGPIPLAIEDGSAQNVPFSQKFASMLLADMNVISLFTIDERYVKTDFDAPTPAPMHANAQYLLRYRLINDQAGGMKADVKLLREGAILFTKSYVLQQSDMVVFLSHMIAFDINAKLGGTPVDWMKRKVLFVRLTAAKQSEIVVADYTLSYQKVILRGGMFNFAKWANKEQTDFYYTSLSDFRPTIYKMNLRNGNREKVISSDGMAVCSDVSADGKKLLLTLAPSGQPDIYQYDTSTHEKIRLTDYAGIDVSGQYLGDNSIAFVSNRLGYPNIFMKSVNSTAINQLVFQGKNNSSLSSYQNMLVYKSRDSGGNVNGNSFNLYLLSMNSGNVKRLTASGENDYPRFSGDGEAILFIKQEGARSSLGVIRVGLNKSFAFPLKAGRIASIDW